MDGEFAPESRCENCWEEAERRHAAGDPREVVAIYQATHVEFFVAGLAAPGGSKKGFISPRTGRVVIVDDAKRNADWKSLVSLAASGNFERPMDGPLSLELHFIMPRPKGHFGTGRNAGKLRPMAPLLHQINPDVTKLVRSTEDALKAIAWLDDCQIVWQVASKVYGERPGCRITVKSMDFHAMFAAKGEAL